MKNEPTTTTPDWNRRDWLTSAGIGALGVTGLMLSQTASAQMAKAVGARPASAATLPWPPAASFSSKAIIGPHQPSAAVMMDPRELLGLPVERAFVYGNLRWANGEMSEWVRGFYMGKQPARQGLFVQSTVGKDTLRSVPEIFMPAARRWTASMEGNLGVWRPAADDTGKPFRFTMAADGATITWTEEGILDLTGKLLGPGLQWHVPDVDGSALYVSQIYEVSGTALGQPVKGIMAFDKVHLPVDQPLYSGKDPLFRPTQHHRTWYTWGNRYEDGSYDAGHFLLGSDRMGFALIANERGQPVLDTEVTGEVKLAPGTLFPASISLRTSKGERWQFTPDPKGRMPDMLKPGASQATTPQNEGQWRRVGDKRKPAVWFAWGEVAPEGLTKYLRHHQF